MRFRIFSAGISLNFSIFKKRVNMISRRKVISLLSGIPILGFLTGQISLSPQAKGNPVLRGSQVSVYPSIYEKIGVRPLINARGTVTIIGASRVLPEVLQAMDEASRDYVQLDELMEGVGRRLATLTGAEWGIVTSGASAAITAATAGCVTGGDPDKLWQIPDLGGMRDEVIIPAYSQSAYDAAAKAVGVRMVVVENKEELENALGPRTAMILVLAGNRSENGPLSLQDIASLAKPLQVPILVDAAAEGLTVPNPHLMQGADMVAYSGGKYLQGPQCSGLLLGRKDLVQASWITVAPHHGFGRGFKVGREEIMGLLTAVEMWMKRDHEGIMAQWTSRLEYIARELKKVEGVNSEIIPPQGRSNHSPNLMVSWDTALIPLTGQQMEQLLWDENPRIAVSGAGSYLPFPPNLQPYISINSSQLSDGEEKIIANKVLGILKLPHYDDTSLKPTAYDVGGLWNLEMFFAASTVMQSLAIEQNQNQLKGIHYGHFAPRKFSGTISGEDITIQSSYTEQGVRLNFEFSGKVDREGMKGQVSMGEYGKGDWKATRKFF